MDAVDVIQGMICVASERIGPREEIRWRTYENVYQNQYL